MKASHQDYARARKHLRDAQTVAVEVTGDDVASAQAAGDLSAAEKSMRDAEDKVRVDFDRAWEANRQAVQDASAAVDAAMKHRLEVESEVGEAAAREQRRFFTKDEMSRCWQAREGWLAAKDALEQAKERFKAGVTAEQLAEA